MINDQSADVQQAGGAPETSGPLSRLVKKQAASPTQPPRPDEASGAERPEAQSVGQVAASLSGSAPSQPPSAASQPAANPPSVDAPSADQPSTAQSPGEQSATDPARSAPSPEAAKGGRMQGESPAATAGPEQSPSSRPERSGSPHPSSPQRQAVKGARAERGEAAVSDQADEATGAAEGTAVREPEVEPTRAKLMHIDPHQVDADEDEIQAALGGLSMDRVLSAEATSADSVDVIPGDTRLVAQVVKVDAESVFFSLGGQNEGMAPRRQFSELPAVGQTMDVVVTRFLPEEGLYELRIPGATVSVGDWTDLEEGVIVEARITGHNQGGLECEVNAIRGFIPASQVSLYRVEDLESFVGQKLRCVVTEANPRRRNLVLSHRAVLERERQEARRKLLEELQPGQVREAVVRNLRDFGAFVDLGGVDGLIPIGQLSWDRISHPRDVLEEGQRVRVKVERVDPQTGKISLSYRDLLDNPWTDIENRFAVGAVVPGEVTKIMEFGAFVRIAPGVEGLVHISELAHRRVQRVSQVVQEGQSVSVKILSVDKENQRISLSIKAAQVSQEEPAEEAPKDAAPASPPPQPRRVSRQPLRGGTDRKTGGEQFGLNW